jgi:putative transposase
VLSGHGAPIAPSTYYAAKSRPPSARAVRDGQLKAEITRVWKENYEVYGADKVWLELNRQGISVARCTVERLMRGLGLQGARRGRKVRTTVRDERLERAGDLLGRDFTAPAPNRRWVADFERHEAPGIRVEVKGLHRRAVAAVRLKRRAA